MKRFTLLILCLVVSVSWSFSVPAQETAAAIAARQENEERFKRLARDVEALQEAHAALQKKINALVEELQKVRDETSRSTAKYATQEDVKYLQEKLQEVDKKRETGDEQILAEIKKLLNTVVAPPPAPKLERKDKPERLDKTEKSNGVSPKKTAAEEGYWYVVQDKDRLATIIQHYRDSGVKVTLKQILDANPKLDPNKLIPGKTRIWIPQPPPE